MSNNSFASRVALPVVLHETHTEAIRAEFPNLDLGVSEADLLSATRAVQPSNGVHGTRLDSRHLVLDSGRCSYNTPTKAVFPVEFPGASHGILMSSTVPALDGPESQARETRILVLDDGPFDEQRLRDRTFQLPHAFATVFRKQLLGEDAKGLSIFTAPDLPPVAIHEDDVRYVRRQHGGNLNFTDVVSKTEQLFGDSALEFLSESVCTSLITAIQNSQHEILARPN
ncbi:hypothetical protein EYC59_04000 [Candidatus Saccharibacteria bacterium]|nr:MAG: hypothetical protein EYC59_04000 [Candidatus Saccharibacteria bacterium]